jgi:PIN domain nuclease of toxin-antitoxin system
MSPGRDVVLDASALVALMCDEPGADTVSDAMRSGCMISAVNLAEALETFVVHGRERPGSLAYALTAVGVQIGSYGPNNAEGTARLRHLTGMGEIGFGGRACLELAWSSGRPILTADEAMLTPAEGAGIEVRLIREAARSISTAAKAAGP